MLTALVLVSALAFTASATSSSTSASASTTSVFLPIIDSQPLVASLGSTSAEIKTMVIQCPKGTDNDNCGFPTPVTVTAGPSTLALTTTVGDTMVVDLKCGITGGTEAKCTQIYTGPASLKEASLTGDDGSTTTTWTASQTLSSGKVSFMPVTITAGAATTGKNAAVAMPAPTGAAKLVVVAVVVQQFVAGLA